MRRVGGYSISMHALVTDSNLLFFARTFGLVHVLAPFDSYNASWDLCVEHICETT